MIPPEERPGGMKWSDLNLFLILFIIFNLMFFVVMPIWFVANEAGLIPEWAKDLVHWVGLR